MKREQHELIVERFELEQYDRYNRKSNWSGSTEEFEFSWSDVDVSRWRDTFLINSSMMVLYQGIPTKELAEEIIQFGKDTEILFV